MRRNAQGKLWHRRLFQMSRILLNASVIFSAVYSPEGGAAKLLRSSLRGEVNLVASQYTLEEARRNLSKKASEVIVPLQML